MTVTKRDTAHYEVHGLRGSSWTILEVEDEEAPAIGLAKRHWETSKYKAVRVLRERYDTETSTFISQERFHRGVRRKSSKHDEEPIKLCWKTEDLYSYEGRRMINRLLREALDRFGISALELLHCSAHYYRLDNAGTIIQNAVQRAAISQVKETEETVQERMKKLYTLISNAATEMKKAEEKGQIPDFDGQPYDDLLASLREKSNRGFLLTSSLAHHFKEMAGPGEKFDRILALLRHNHDAWVSRVLDEHASEMLRNRKLVDRLLTPEKDSAVEPLLVLTRLIDGQLQPEQEAALPEQTRRLNHFLKDGYLQNCRQVLVNWLAEDITGSRHLSGSDLFLMAKRIHELNEIIASGHEMLFNGIPISEVLVEREGRALNAQSIGQFVSDVTCPVDTVERLMDLEAYILGQQNKRTLANFILPVLESPENEAALRGANQKYSSHMRRLATLQRRILNSGIQDTHKRKMAELLDHFCAATAKHNGFFKRLAEAPSSPPEKGRTILNMLAEGYFTEGATATAARKEAKRYLKDPDFLNELMASVREDDRAKALQEFRNLLVAAGVAPASTGAGEETASRTSASDKQAR